MIGAVCFDMDQQLRFATLSGDHNPIHVDPIAVRRTLPARLVVHGVHVLLWSLGVLARTYDGELPQIGRIRVRFLRFTYVGDEVRLVRSAGREGEIRLSVMTEDVVRADIRLTFDALGTCDPIMPGGEAHLPGTGPLDHDGISFDDRRGTVRFMTPAGTIASSLPGAARWLGEERIDALAAATRLVGMIYPGLYSVLGGIDVRLTPGDGAGALAFEMGEQRHGQIDAIIAGGGISGTLDCRVPHAPVPQPASADLRDLVAPGRFAGTQVLVVGGSRGAGEAAAKLLALGGADVTITYRDGAADAAAVAAEIVEAGGLCATMRFDAGQPIDEQLGDLIPSHVCWFASPPMVRTDAKLPDDKRLSAYLGVLATSFSLVAAALHARRSDLRLFYPSTTWIEAPPAGLTEYCMAKAAGEVLARSMEAWLTRGRVFAPRLPAMATDQTARLGIAGGSAPWTLIPHLERLMSTT